MSKRRDGFEGNIPEMPWKKWKKEEELDWEEEDPGTCAKCNTPFVLVRPGKSQPNCTCWDIPERGCFLTALPNIERWD